MNKKYVSRSRFQQEAEKCKRLQREIVILTHPKYSMSQERMDLILFYRKNFKQEERFNRILTEILTGKITTEK